MYSGREKGITFIMPEKILTQAMCKSLWYASTPKTYHKRTLEGTVYH